MTFDNLLLQMVNAVAVVTVNRPKLLNALNLKTVDELDACIAELSTDAGVRAIVITGAGDRSFIAGADISEVARMTPTMAHDAAQRGQALCSRIERCKQAGHRCDQWILRSEVAASSRWPVRCGLRPTQQKLGQPEITLGLLPGFGGTQRLPRLVGPGRALELMLSGDLIDAQEAWRLGLVNRVVAADRIRDESLALAKSFAERAPVAVRYILGAVRDGMQMTLDEGCAHEASLFGLAAATADMREGTQAFLEKRRAEFKGQ